MYECDFMLTVDSIQDQYDNFSIEDKLGMKVTSGVVTINKDPKTNRIGITIGGGPPYCPCIYITQILEYSPTALNGALESGDELLAINDERISGRDKMQVAQMIQSSGDQVTLKYNKLEADIEQGKTMDILVKKIKHRIVEGISATTADYLGISRAMLVNDSLVKRLQELDNLEQTYRCLVDHTECVLGAFYALTECYKEFGDSFSEIGAREPQPRASMSLMRFGEYHRRMERQGQTLINVLKLASKSFSTYLKIAIPDTKQTIRKYADVKFEYLSYCLKIKELDDEETSLDYPIRRILTGNYEYRLLLRCQQSARKRFIAIREDVLTKIELLESKHVHDIVDQFQLIASQIVNFNNEISWMILGGDNDTNEPPLFPIEMDLKCTAFEYDSVQPEVNLDDLNNQNTIITTEITTI